MRQKAARLALTLVALLAPAATGAAATPNLSLLSVAQDGTQGNDHSGRFGGDVSISADGRYVAFASEATNLVPGDTNGAIDIFIRDRQADTISRVTAPAGVQPNGASQQPVVSPDGRYLAFGSSASNLVPNDANGYLDGFVLDRTTGAIELVTVGQGGVQGNHLSSMPTISADGQRVAFWSYASNLTPGDANNKSDVFLRDRATDTTTRLSVTPSGGDPDGLSQVPQISDDGTVVAYETDATNILLGDANGWRDVVVHDLESGTTEAASVSSAGGATTTQASLYDLSGDGRRVVMSAWDDGSLVSSGTNGSYDVFVRDRELGTTSRANPAAWTGYTYPGFRNSISADGRDVAVYTYGGVGPATAGVYVYDTVDGAAADAIVTTDGQPINSTSGTPPVLSADGSTLAVVSDATNLVADDSNGKHDVFAGGVGGGGSPGDTEAPVVTVPSDINTAATSPSGAQVTYTATATDNDDPNPSLDCQPPSGSTFPVGTTTVTCTATDTSGNSSQKSFDVTVAEPLDSDGDGLYDVIEIWLGGDPHKADTDDDGVSDRIEVLLGTNPTAHDSDPDDDENSDGSYLVKVYGTRCGCGPEDDIDGDGVSTWVELKYGTNPNSDEIEGGGGWSSMIEYIWHLCGCKPIDEDGNGVPTMIEKHYGGGGILEIIRRCGCMPWEDPSGGGGGIWIDFRYVGGPYDEPDDPDGDGIDTVIEIWLGCDPHEADTDGDGLDDRRELQLGTDPTKADTDGDGMNDKREIDLGCDPLDPDSDGDGHLDGVDPAPLVKVTLVVTPGTPVPVGSSVQGTLTCLAAKPGAVTGSSVDWGDGSSSAGSTTGLQQNKSYTSPGVYPVAGSCTDTTGGTQTETHEYVVVYDPSGGFITGGGWIESPPGALRSDPSATGRANFGFVSKYKSGATAPAGATEFQLEVGDLNFHSNAHDWLVVKGTAAGGYSSEFKGTGTIQGRSGTFSFHVRATDGAQSAKPDGFRISITGAKKSVIYDNGSTQPIANGSIVVHPK